MFKLLYKPVQIVVGIVTGILAGTIFKQIWKLVAHEEEAPQATDIRKGWREILLASAIQGLIFSVVKAAVDRGTAEGTLRLTGVWPGQDSQAEQEKKEAKQEAKQAKKAKKAT